LRAPEVVALKVGDVDSKRMLLRVEQGKGRKDRHAMLSSELLELLRAWWREGGRLSARCCRWACCSPVAISSIPLDPAILALPTGGVEPLDPLQAGAQSAIVETDRRLRVAIEDRPFSPPPIVFWRLATPIWGCSKKRAGR
jgi:integrase